MADTTQNTTTPMGSAPVQGPLWGARARDFMEFEPMMAPLYESAAERVTIGPGTAVLDVGCGPGGFLELAAARGADVAGIDAAAPSIELAAERLDDAELAVGDMESLPFDDDRFDVVTGFNAFQFAADPANALRQAARVGRTGAPVVIATWGRPDQCEAAAYVKAVGGLLPPPPPGAPGPFALSEDGAIEAFAAAGGLDPEQRHEVLCVWSYRDDDHAVRALSSTGFAVKAADVAGRQAVEDAILGALEPFATSDGGYRVENVFTYLVARV